ncbi:MAG: aspartate/glutamate racemase family protein [Sphingomonadales bacterium]|nr:aspartate/glutamate racemase family protein [Sphingomonadales bacterium]MDE2168015.1 aspartate/glutamate racemase family protein [Sphingomonadales bacterium]
MRRIGLIGGMSFESTIVYYRLLNEAIRTARGGLSSADLVMHSVDFAPIAQMQSEDRWEDAGRELASAARGLEAAGAQAMLICTNTMHLVADAVAGAISVPLIHVIDETAAALKQAGCRRPLLLATRYTMEQGFYQTHMARHDIEVMVPDAQARKEAHAIIFEELCQGQVLDASRQILLTIIEAAKARGADSVILGCTELGLILDPEALMLPGFDSAVIHVQAAARFALGT